MAVTNPERISVPVELGERSYEIAITSGELDQCPAAIAQWCQRRGYRGRTALIVTDPHVHRPHAATVSAGLSRDGWNCAVAELPAGEETKSQVQLSALYDRLVDMGADRSTVVVAVGGGVIGDLAGFVAATYARGIPFVQIPTTLLSMVDSSVGGKVGINHSRAKNLIGAFHQPLGVFIDTQVLDTLPERDYVAGLAEVAKYGMILDARFFELLEKSVDAIHQRTPAAVRQMVARSCELKAQVVEKDEFERTGLRAVLNYGHTFGHAYEALCGYGTLLHGEAVAIGMEHAGRLAVLLNRIPAELLARQNALLSALRLPNRLPADANLTVENVLDRMRLDKKSVSGQLRFILPNRLGHVELVSDIPETVVRQLLLEFLS